MIGIYCIASKSTNKVYIGCSNDIRRRFSEHLSSLSKNCHCNEYLQRHFNKYGLKDFTFTIIEELTSISELKNKEMYYISKYKSNTSKLGFNLTSGGEDLCNLSKQAKINKRNSIVNKLKPLYCYKTDGTFVGKYKCAPDAAKILGLNRNSITNAVNRSIQLKGYLFYKEEKSFSKYKPNYHSSNIIVFDKNGNEIESFKWMKDVAEKYNIKYNTMNTLCNRMSLYKDRYFFIRERQLQTYIDKLESFGEDKLAMKLFDQEFQEG